MFCVVFLTITIDFASNSNLTYSNFTPALTFAIFAVTVTVSNFTFAITKPPHFLFFSSFLLVHEFHLQVTKAFGHHSCQPGFAGHDEQLMSLGQLANSFLSYLPAAPHTGNSIPMDAFSALSVLRHLI